MRWICLQMRQRIRFKNSGRRHLCGGPGRWSTTTLPPSMHELTRRINGGGWCVSQRPQVHRAEQRQYLKMAISQMRPAALAQLFLWCDLPSTLIQNSTFGSRPPLSFRRQPAALLLRYCYGNHRHPRLNIRPAGGTPKKAALAVLGALYRFSLAICIAICIAIALRWPATAAVAAAVV